MSEERRKFAINPGPLKLVKYRLGDFEPAPSFGQCEEWVRSAKNGDGQCMRDGSEYAGEAWLCWQHAKMRKASRASS